MKARMIAVLALSALTLSPVFGAPRKTTSSNRSKPASEKAAPAPEQKMSAKQATARELVAELTSTQKSRMLTLLNEGTAKELADIKGVSETRAAAIEKARPFESIDEVILVSGIGKVTITEIVGHARGLTSTRSKTSPSASSTKKKGASKKEKS